MNNILRRMRGLSCLLAATVFLASCASSSSGVKPTFVSETKYANHSCQMINSEMELVSERALAIAKEQDDNATADAVLMGVGLIIFWPALIGLAFTEDQEAELSKLRGEQEALERAAARKGC